MKKILTLIAFFGTIAFTKANVVFTSVTAGDNLQITATWKATINPTDTAFAQLQWASFPGGAAHPANGMTATFTDSLTRTHIWTAPSAGQYYMREFLTLKDTAGNTSIDTTIWYPVALDSPYVVPTLSFAGPLAADGGGALAQLNLNPGHTSAVLRCWISVGSLTYDPNFAYLFDSMTVTGGQQVYSHHITGISNGSIAEQFAVKYDVRNVKGFAATGVAATTTTVAGSSPFVATHADSSGINALDTSVYVRYQGLTHGATSTGVIRIKLATSLVWTDSLPLGTFVSSNNPIVLQKTITGLQYDLKYVRQVRLTNQYGSGYSAVDTFKVDMPEMFILIPDTSWYAGGTSQRVRARLNNIGVTSLTFILTEIQNVNYSPGIAPLSYPTSTPQTQVFNTSGIFYPEATFSGLIDGMSYRVKPIGNDDLGHFVQVSAGGDITFTFHVPQVVDSVNPVLISLDSIAGSNTYNRLYFNATDNNGIDIYKLMRNGDSLATVNGSTHVYDDISAVSNTVYTYTCVARDLYGNWSNLKTLSVHTKPDPSTYQQIVVNSIEDNLCFQQGQPGVGVWGTVHFTAQHLTAQTRAHVDYASPGQDYDYTVTMTSATEAYVPFWLSKLDMATLTFTNPGTAVSNAVVTHVVFCTGIEEVETNKNTGLTFQTNSPNPCTNEFAFTIGGNQNANDTYQVYSMFGQLVRTGQCAFGTNSIDMSDLAPGTYLFKTINNGFTRKISKQ